jgi:tRNA 2-thiouridine synthesizing protein A
MRMSEIKVDCTNKGCPIPLVETRKALWKAKEGDIIEVIGTHHASKKEIPMAVKALGSQVISTQENEGIWRIKIRK